MKHNNCPYLKNCTIEECDSSCIRYREMRYLIDSSFIPPLYQTPIVLRPQNDNDAKVFGSLREIKDKIEIFVKEGRNLYLCSKNTGTGKTSSAIKLLLKYFDRIWSGNGFRTRGLFIHVPTFLLQLKNFDDPLTNKYKKDIIDADLVIWDDIATSALSDWDYNQLLLYIESRINNKKSNIYTSNITDKTQLEKIIGGRLVSRIYSTSIKLEFTGKDYRHGTSPDNQ